MSEYTRKKERTSDEKRLLTNRLSRIEGQIRGLKNMVENDCYCLDIINQAAAANAAINSFCKKLLEKHLKSCVVNDIKSGNDNKLNELLEILDKLI